MQIKSHVKSIVIICHLGKNFIQISCLITSTALQGSFLKKTTTRKIVFLIPESVAQAQEYF